MLDIICTRRTPRALRRALFLLGHGQRVALACLSTEPRRFGCRRGRPCSDSRCLQRRPPPRLRKEKKQWGKRKVGEKVEMEAKDWTSRNKSHWRREIRWSHILFFWFGWISLTDTNLHGGSGATTCNSLRCSCP
jgi:hypothetical protein